LWSSVGAFFLAGDIATAMDLRQPSPIVVPQRNLAIGPVPHGYAAPPNSVVETSPLSDRSLRFSPTSEVDKLCFSDGASLCGYVRDILAHRIHEDQPTAGGGLQSPTEQSEQQSFRSSPRSKQRDPSSRMGQPRRSPTGQPQETPGERPDYNVCGIGGTAIAREKFANETTPGEDKLGDQGLTLRKQIEEYNALHAACGKGVAKQEAESPVSLSPTDELVAGLPDIPPQVPAATSVKGVVGGGGMSEDAVDPHPRKEPAPSKPAVQTEYVDWLGERRMYRKPQKIKATQKEQMDDLALGKGDIYTPTPTSDSSDTL